MGAGVLFPGINRTECGVYHPPPSRSQVKNQQTCIFTPPSRCRHGLLRCDHLPFFLKTLNPLNAELNPICHLLALLGGATIVVVSRLRVKQSDHNPKHCRKINFGIKFSEFCRNQSKLSALFIHNTRTDAIVTVAVTGTEARQREPRKASTPICQFRHITSD